MIMQLIYNSSGIIMRLTVPPPVHAIAQPLDRICVQSAVSVAVATVVGVIVQQVIPGVKDSGSNEIVDLAVDSVIDVLF
jgi:hypothetical protein